MNLLVILLLFAVAVFLAAVFSGCETGIYCLGRVRLKVHAEQGDRRAQRVAYVLRDNQSALSLTLLGTNLAEYLATVCFAFLLSRGFGFSQRETEIYTTLIVALIILVLGEMVPKSLFQAHPNRLMFWASPILRPAFGILFPAVWVLTQLTSRFTALFGDPARLRAAADPRKQMARLLQDGMAAGEHHQAHHEMVDRTLLLAEMPVHRVMTPRNRVVAIAADAGRDRLLNLARAKPHSRIPVFIRHPRRIEGMVEVARLLDDDTWRSVGERMTPVTRLDPHESVGAALVRFQREHARMAVVVDRGGYLLGVVTLKDLVEELVGELPMW